jgi:hypothetical protein
MKKANCTRRVEESEKEGTMVCVGFENERWQACAIPWAGLLCVTYKGGANERRRQLC